MRIAYLTTDEVNQELALRLAAGQEAQLEVIWPRDEPPDGRFDAVIYDLDCLPPPLRQQLLTDLAGGRAPPPTGFRGPTPSFGSEWPALEQNRPAARDLGSDRVTIIRRVTASPRGQRSGMLTRARLPA